MVATMVYSVTTLFWKETTFPLWRAVNRYWNMNAVCLVSSVMLPPISCVSSTAKCHQSPRQIGETCVLANLTQLLTILPLLLSWLSWLYEESWYVQLRRWKDCQRHQAGETWGSEQLPPTTDELESPRTTTRRDTAQCVTAQRVTAQCFMVVLCAIITTIIIIIKDFRGAGRHRMLRRTKSVPK